MKTYQELGQFTWTIIGLALHEAAGALAAAIEGGLDSCPGAGLLPSQASAPRAPVAVAAIH